MSHDYWMSEALSLAKTAYNLGEVPVGAVIVKDNNIIAAGYNMRETQKNSTYHAELVAINKACAALNSWRLEDCTLYVTLEPCPMCAGAIINSRIPTLVFGASDNKSGCYGSLADFNNLNFNHKPEVISGVMAEQSSELLRSFFRLLRK